MIFELYYRTMIKKYGPIYVEADDELEAKTKGALILFPEGLNFISAVPFSGEIKKPFKIWLKTDLLRRSA